MPWRVKAVVEIGARYGRGLTASNEVISGPWENISRAFEEANLTSSCHQDIALSSAAEYSPCMHLDPPV